MSPNPRHHVFPGAATHNAVVIASFHPQIGPVYWACDLRKKPAGANPYGLTTNPTMAAQFLPGGAILPSVFDSNDDTHPLSDAFSADSIMGLAQRNDSDAGQIKTWLNTAMWIERPAPGIAAQSSGFREMTPAFHTPVPNAYAEKSIWAGDGTAAVNFAIEADASWAMCILTRQHGLDTPEQRSVAMAFEQKSLLNAMLAGESYIAGGGRGTVPGHIDRVVALRAAFDIGVALALYSMASQTSAEAVAA